MAPSVKFHVFRGTRVYRGVDDRERDHAQVRASVTGLGNSTSDNTDAIEQAISDAGLTHHSETGLPLASVRHTKYSRTKGRAVLDYRRGPSADPTQPAFSIAEELDAGDERQKVWYDQDGNKITNFPYESNNRPLSATLRLPVFNVRVPFVLDQHPIADQNTDILARHGATNLDSVVINGVSRPQFTLMFMGTSIRAIDTRNGIRYAGEYVYQYLASGWTEKRLFTSFVFGYDSNNNFYGGFNFRVSQDLESPTALFADAFPTHGGEAAQGGTDGYGPVAG